MSGKKIYWPVVFIISLQLIIILTLTGQHRFHGDEALYARWAQDMAKSSGIYVDSPYLLYKPPVYLFAAALSYAIFPVREIFAVIPNCLATVLSTLLVFMITSKLYSDKIKGLTAAILFALVPYIDLFAPTAFLDPLMVMFCLAAFLSVLEGRMLLAGIVFGLALGTKQFAVFYLPVYLLFYLVSGNKIRLKSFLGDFLLFLSGFTASFGVSVLWGILNSLHHHKPFYFALNSWFGNQDRTEIYKLSFNSMYGRMGEWLVYYGNIFVRPWISVLVLMFVTASLALKRERPSALLAASLLFLFLFTSISRMPIYDRYILTFLPLVLILCGASISSLINLKNDRIKMYVIMAAVFVVMFSGPIHDMYKYRIKNLQKENFGAQYSRNDGLTQITGVLLQDYGMPVCVAAHPDFSWVFDYYMFGSPEGYCWYNIENLMKMDGGIAKNTGNRVNMMLFYSDNDRIDDYRGLLKKKDLKL